MTTDVERITDTLLVEVAWEVCNQVGGIYTVLRTKAQSMINRWGNRYLLIGPYEPHSAAVEFEERPPDSAYLYKLQDMGHPVKFGRWLIPGRPEVILVDYRQRYHSLHDEKYYLWRDFGIDTSVYDKEVDDLIAFNYGVAAILRDLTVILSGNTGGSLHTVLAHFHEWMAGVPAAIIRKANLPIGTIFTTHATLLGRYVAGNNPNFYAELERINPWDAARHYNIFTRFSLERLCAQESDVFTTISEVTGREARQFLGREPDEILPNGLNVNRFTALHEFQNLHLRFKEKIHEFVMGHFFPTYSFDLDRTLYFFISGRYEFRNKGMDLFIEALHRLNGRLKQLPDPPTIIGFIITKGTVRHINVEALQNHMMFDDLVTLCKEIESSVGRRLLDAVVQGRLPTLEELLPQETQMDLKRGSHSFRSTKLPSIVTHDIVDDEKDPILQHLRHRGLFNDASDPVKIIFHPGFINPSSPLIRMEYEQFVRGCHMGVFPSYYEPWGYTPLECVAMGIPAITTDLTGFGGFVEKNVPEPAQNGIYVINRTSKSTGESIDDLTNHLYQFCMHSRRERIELRNRVERLVNMFDWSVLATHYHRSHDLALDRLRQRVTF